MGILGFMGELVMFHVFMSELTASISRALFLYTSKIDIIKLIKSFDGNDWIREDLIVSNRPLS